MAKVAYKVAVDGTMTRLPTTVAKMKLADVQATVGGDVDHVRGQDGTDLWCNENGLAERLPYNPLASKITGLYVIGVVIIERFMQKGY